MRVMLDTNVLISALLFPSKHMDLLFEKIFGYVAIGEPMIYNNELMKVAIAVSQGNFCKEYHADFGPLWTVTFTK